VVALKVPEGEYRASVFNSMSGLWDQVVASVICDIYFNNDFTNITTCDLHVFYNFPPMSVEFLNITYSKGPTERKVERDLSAMTSPVQTQYYKFMIAGVTQSGPYFQVTDVASGVDFEFSFFLKYYKSY